MSSHRKCHRHAKAAIGGSCRLSCLNWLKRGFIWARGLLLDIFTLCVNCIFAGCVPGSCQSSELILSPNLSLQGSSFCPVTQLILHSIDKEQTLSQTTHSTDANNPRAPQSLQNVAPIASIAHTHSIHRDPLRETGLLAAT